MPRPILLESKINDDVVFGEQVKIVQPVNLYGCSIGENGFIGPFVEIQKDVHIGKNCKVQSHAFICELVTIGNNCFIGHGVMFINDLFWVADLPPGIKQNGNIPSLEIMFP